MMSNQNKYHDSTGSWIAEDFKHSTNFIHELNYNIEPDVVVGDKVTVGMLIERKLLSFTK